MPTLKDAEVLRKAANLMKKSGHARGRLITPDGQMCLAGAINMAVNRDPVNWGTRTNKLLRKVADYLCRKQKLPAGSIDPVSWNNYSAKDGEEVIAALRGAARSAARS